MISLADSRRILGPAAQNFSDEEIMLIRDLLHELAENVMAGAMPSPLALLRLTSVSTSTSSAKPDQGKRHCSAI
jgi:hypothetical protein